MKSHYNVFDLCGLCIVQTISVLLMFKLLFNGKCYNTIIINGKSLRKKQCQKKSQKKSANNMPIFGDSLGFLSDLSQIRQKPVMALNLSSCQI